METTETESNIKNRLIRIVLAAELILMVPLVAMQFTDEVDWDLFDFIVAGFLLLGTGFAYVLTTRNVSSRRRVIIGAVLAALLLFVWAELAVGIIGTPFAGQ